LKDKGYGIYHQKDGWEGLTLAQQKLSDLIVTDLTMPGMDDFGLVKELKLDPRARDILVVSAKAITLEERKRLPGHTEAVYQKSSLSARKFVDQVIQVLAESNEAQGGQL
jgi:CheY-like chemotaxis protein